ncbi:MAG: secretin N-terminal domain-containing protein [Burkholderiales bacterium]
MKLKTMSALFSLVVVALGAGTEALARDPKAIAPIIQNDKVSMNFSDQPIQEVVNALSRTHQVNIILGKGVTGNISLNLYNVSLEQAIQSVADSAGFALENRSGNFYIVDRKDVSQDAAYGVTAIKSFKIQYSDPKKASEILTKYLSRYGKLTLLEERKMVIVEDAPDFLGRMQRLLQEIDVEPKQIMIEAKILEITLDNTESFGVDWSKIFSGGGNGGTNSLGTQGIANRNQAGLFFNYFNNNIQLYLNALSTKGRVHTLSTPKLLTLENQEATTKVGKNFGYLSSTTANNITTSSVSFLETGVILKVTPSVDDQGRIMMKIHPEVSTGSIRTAGGNSIPDKSTTEVTTQMLANDGQPILIGGLIKNVTSRNRNGVPVIGDIPIFGALFSSTDDVIATTETIVIITPYIVKQPSSTVTSDTVSKIDSSQQTFLRQSNQLETVLESPTYKIHNNFLDNNLPVAK